MSLVGCGRSVEPAPAALKRDLPAGPSYARPVEVSDPKAGEDAIAVIARERAGRAQANDVILCFVDWYAQVRAAYGRDAAEQGAAAARSNCETQSNNKAKR